MPRVLLSRRGLQGCELTRHVVEELLESSIADGWDDDSSYVGRRWDDGSSRSRGSWRGRGDSETETMDDVLRRGFLEGNLREVRRSRRILVAEDGGPRVGCRSGGGRSDSLRSGPRRRGGRGCSFDVNGLRSRSCDGGSRSLRSSSRFLMGGRSWSKGREVVFDDGDGRRRRRAHRRSVVNRGRGGSSSLNFRDVDLPLSRDRFPYGD